MDFFNSAVDVLQTLVIALGAGLGIGEQSGWTRSTIERHIQLALKRLKEEMEVLSYE